MPPSLRTVSLGLLLIVVGLAVDFLAGFAEPALPACSTTLCNAGLAAGLLALTLMLVGIAVQVWVLSRWKAESVLRPGSADEFRPGGAIPSSLPSPPVFPGAGFPPIAPPPGPGAPPTIRCPRCQGAYPAGSYAYCPACGTPLPFAP